MPCKVFFFFFTPPSGSTLTLLASALVNERYFGAVLRPVMDVILSSSGNKDNVSGKAAISIFQVECMTPEILCRVLTTLPCCEDIVYHT